MGGNTGGTFVFLTIVGSFFGFMLLLALVAARIRSSRSVRGNEWSNLSDVPASVLEVLLMLVWGVVILAALMACAIALVTVVFASTSIAFASEMKRSDLLRDLLTIQLVDGIVIGASLIVGLALLVPLFISELHERHSPFLPRRPRRELYRPPAARQVEGLAQSSDDEERVLIERRAVGRSIS